MSLHVAPEPAGPDLSVGNCLGQAWRTFQANAGLVLGASVVWFVLSFAAGSIPLLPLIVSGPLLVGASFLALKLIRGEPAEVADLFAGFRAFGRALGCYLLHSLIMLAVGLIFVLAAALLILVGNAIPGLAAVTWIISVATVVLALLYVIGGLIAWQWLVLDADLGIVETLRYAWELSAPWRVPMLVLVVIAVVLVLVGVVLFFIGLIVTMPLALLMMTAAYNELVGGRTQREPVEAPAPVEPEPDAANPL